MSFIDTDLLLAEKAPTFRNPYILPQKPFRSQRPHAKESLHVAALDRQRFGWKVWNGWNTSQCCQTETVFLLNLEVSLFLSRVRGPSWNGAIEATLTSNLTMKV